MIDNGQTTRSIATIPSRRAGAVLLEVVLALTLFFIAGAVILAGLHSTLKSAGRMKDQARGMDLAVTVLSRIQMGLVQINTNITTETDPAAFEDDPDSEGWTWQVIATPLDDLANEISMSQVEVIIRPPEGEQAYRLVQLMAIDNELTGEETAMRGGGQ